MPPEAFDREWEEASGHSLYERVLKVKRIFHVSYRTVLRRLRDLNQVSDQVYLEFQVQHKRRFKTTLKKTDEPEGLEERNFDARYVVKEPESLANVDFMDDRLAKLAFKASRDVGDTLQRDRLDDVPLGHVQIALGHWRKCTTHVARRWAVRAEGRRMGWARCQGCCCSEVIVSPPERNRNVP